MEPQVDSNAKLLIKTASADGIIDPDQQVYVKLVGGYVRKSAQDLQPGDLVVVRRDCINKTIDDISPFIREGSMMYRLAEDRLYKYPKTQEDQERTSQDLRKPLLSVLLLEGLTRDSTEPRKTLEDKIYGINGQNFSPEEYTRFADQVHTVLKDGLLSRGKTLDHLVSIDTIRTWLKGDTLAPQHWENLECLIQINPEFEVELHAEKAGLNLHSAYDFVMQTRRVVMNSLLHAPNASGQSNGEGQKGKGKYALEIQLAMAQLIDSVDSTTIASRIMSIEPLGTQKIGPKTERAIYTGPLNVPILPMQHVKEISYLLDQALHNLLERYATQRALEKGREALNAVGIDIAAFDSKEALLNGVETIFKEKCFEVPMQSQDITFSLTHLKELIALKTASAGKKFDQRLSIANTYFATIAEFFSKLVRICPKEAYVAKENRKILEEDGRPRGEVNKILHNMYREFTLSLTGQNDEFKKMTGISANEFYGLTDLVNRYRNALPKRYFQTVSDDAVTTFDYYILTKLQAENAIRKKRREKEKSVNQGLERSERAIKQLIMEYGITEQKMQLFLTCLVNPQKGVFTNEDKMRVRFSPVSALQTEKERLEREEGIVFYKRAEVAEILETLGIPGIIRAYDPKNFLEMFTTPKPRTAFEVYAEVNLPRPLN